jgi:hypothetical protein
MLSLPKTPQQIGEYINSKGIFTGGPVQYFESAGRLQFYSLIKEGLMPYSKVLDIGCGCLRAGYWLVRFLDSHCYFGIEPSKQMLQAGSDYCLTPELVRTKNPSFDSNDTFDFSIFGTKFDVVLGRSIWTHASKVQIQTMLDGFVEYSTPGAFFLTSYLPAVWFRYRQSDYKGDKWVGKSPGQTAPGLVRHSTTWIQKACAARGLKLRRLGEEQFNRQYWLKIIKP